MRLFSSFNRLARDVRGNMAIMIALAAMPLFGVAGAALDYSGQGAALAKLQAAVDSGVLAGAASSKERKFQVRRAVWKFAEANGSDKYMSDDSRITVVITDSGVIRATAVGEYPTSLMRLMGYNKLPVTAYAEVKPSSGGSEIALVMDTTGSMNSGGRIDALKAAAARFVKVIDDADGYQDDRVRISLVPYAAYVNVGTDSNGAAWLQPVNLASGETWHGCVGSREAPLNTRDDQYGGTNRIPPIIAGPAVGNASSRELCAQQIEPLTSNQDRLLQRIEGLTAQGLTYIPTGLMWGWRTLSDRAPYTEGAGPTQAAAENIEKYIVLMTDGLNTMEKVPGTPYLNHNGFVTGPTDQLMLDICEEVKAAGIKVFTIGFQLWEPAMKQKLERCASSPENYYDASDSNKLAAAYEAIATKVTTIHLAK